MLRPPSCRRAIVALLCLAALSGPAGCSSGARPDDGRPEFSGVRVLAAENGVAGGPPYLPDNSWTVVDWLIAGPHYRTPVVGTLTTDGVAGEDARTLGVEPLRSRPGERLFLVAFSPERIRPPFAGEGVEPPRAEVVVDGSATPVDQLPQVDRTTSDLPSVGSWPTTVVLLVGARPDASVRLRMTDAGRRQELDLRSGQIDGGPDGPYRDVSTPLTWDDRIPVVLLPGESSREISVGSPLQGAPHSAALTSFLPGPGWAPPGRSFLQIPFPVLSYQPFDQVSLRAGLFVLHEEFDDADVFAFRTADGERVRAVPRRRDVDLSLSGSLTAPRAPVHFDVPAGTTAGTVVLDLRTARLTAAARTTRRPVAWIAPPAPVERLVDLTGR